MSSGIQLQLSREIAPAGHRVWAREQEDLKAVLEADIARWFESFRETEAQFQEHVYSNPNLTDFDLRQHRLCLHSLLHAGEEVAVNCIIWGDRMKRMEEVKPLIAELEKKMKELFKVLLDWHGGIDLQSDIPKSFKEAAKQFSEGNIVPFEEPK